MIIPIFDLKSQYKTIKNEINISIQKILLRGNFILGTEVALFEKEFSSYIGVAHGVGVASGTDALTLAVRVLELSNKEEVLIPVNAYPTYFGVAMGGATVGFVDCNENGNISLTDLKKRITKQTKAIVVVHLYGNPADVIGVRNLLKTLHRRDIHIIEDCAQAHGATIGNKKVGSFGDIAIFSFYPSKNLGAYGDGGMIVLKNKKMGDHVRALRMYGEFKRYETKEVSGVSRLDELQAAILRIKLRYLDRWNARRRVIANQYINGIDTINNCSAISYEAGASYHLFVIKTSCRDDLKKYLDKQGIGCAIHYPTPLHLTKPGKALGYHIGDFPMAEKLSKEILSLPIYPELSNTNIVQILTTIHSFFS